VPYQSPTSDSSGAELGDFHNFTMHFRTTGISARVIGFQ
jgi:hypothetical protein